MNHIDNIFLSLRRDISQQKKILKELESIISSFDETNDSEERKSLLSHIKKLKGKLKEKNDNLPKLLEQVSMTKKLEKNSIETKKSGLKKEKKQDGKIKKQFKKKKPLTKEEKKEKKKIDLGASKLEKGVLKRLIKKEEKERKSEKKGKEDPGFFARTSSKLFSKIAHEMSQKKFFSDMRKNLLKTNLNLVPTAYISMTFASTLISFIISIFLFIFLLFIKIGEFPDIIFVQDLSLRFLQTFWIPIIVPIGVFLFMYTYPSLEKRSLEQKINQELPFATINMSSISGSMVEPTSIFKIIISTSEYPNLKKELTKLMNQINIYGYDLVTALKNSTLNSPSKKLAELYNGLATTITSGGELSNFFDKRAESLLIDYRLEREKYTKTTETFIDVYISVVIAAPMILMLLFMMIQISGLGLQLEPSIITLIMVIGVSIINFVFIMFLQLKQPLS